MPNAESITELFRGPEFEYWATRDFIHSLEEYFIQRFLDPEKDVLEAGTGGGFLLHFMQEQGFKSLRGYDLLPEFVAYAREHDPGGRLQFDCADAAALPYQDEQFSQILYFSHMLCLLPDKEQRDKTVAEAFRILKPGGVALFNVLSYEFRLQSLVHRVYLAWLWMLRKTTGSETPMQYMPMLKQNNRFNRKALLNAGPYFYWFRAREIIDYLRNKGFEVEYAAYRGKDKKPKEVNPEDPVIREATGHLYLACRKPIR
jgi:SAM-dependent methyltransferase